MEISRGHEEEKNLDSARGKGGWITLPFIIVVITTQQTLLHTWQQAEATPMHMQGLIMLCLSTIIPSLRPTPCNIIGGNIDPNCGQTTKNNQYAFLVIALSLATIGFGGTRFILSSIGAFQFDKLKHRRNFFNAYIWAYAAGWAVNYAVLGFVVQEKGRWRVSFGIGIAGNAMGIIFFLVGSRYFRHILPHTNPFIRKLRSLVCGMIKRPKARNSVHDNPSRRSLRSPGQPNSSDDSNTENDTNMTMIESTNSQSQKEENEDMWKVIKILPASSAGVILNTAVATGSTLIVYQASYMDLTIGSHFKLPAESTTICILVFTAITVAIFDVLFFPMWKKIVGVSMKPMQRGGTGQVITVFGMIGLATVEMARLESSMKGHHTMSVLWLIFPLALIGIGAGWYIPGGLTIHFQEFPDSLKCTSTALSSLPIGIGFYLSEVHINVVKGGTTWLPTDVDSGSLDRLYWILATIVAVNFGYYLVCAVYYTYYNWPDPNDLDSHDHKISTNGVDGV
ncbi:Protein NRT1/ PTR FAMILY 2.5 [Bienertia sinuspersici]